MKNRLFKRLSAFAAGTAVALTGALAAMPAASADDGPRVWTLDEVGGSVDWGMYYFQASDGERLPVPGTWDDGTVVEGGLPMNTTVTAYQSEPVYIFWTASFANLGSVSEGDHIFIPSEGHEYDTYTFWGYPSYCDGEVVDDSGDVLLTYQCVDKGVDYVVQPALLGKTSISLPEARANIFSDYTNPRYVNNLLDTVQYTWAGKTFNATKKAPGQPTFVALKGCNSAPGMKLNQTVEGETQVWGTSLRWNCMADGAVQGTYTPTSPSVNENWIYHLHLDKGQSIKGVSLRDVDIDAALAFADDDGVIWFTSLLRENLGSIMKYMREVPAARGSLTDYEAINSVLQPGQWARVHNRDGSWDLAINFGPYYNNALTAVPDNYPEDYWDQWGLDNARAVALKNQMINGNWSVPRLGATVEVTADAGSTVKGVETFYGKTYQKYPTNINYTIANPSSTGIDVKDRVLAVVNSAGDPVKQVVMVNSAGEDVSGMPVVASPSVDDPIGAGITVDVDGTVRVPDDADGRPANSLKLVIDDTNGDGVLDTIKTDSVTYSPTIDDKIKDENGNPVPASDQDGNDVSNKPVDDDVNITVDPSIKCKNAFDTACVADNGDGTVTVRDDENGNPPGGVVVTATDTDGDGLIDDITITGTTPAETISDKITDEHGNPVPAKDEDGNDVSDKPVDKDVTIDVDPAAQCQSATDTACVVVNYDGTVTVKDDENGNPSGVVVTAEDTDGDGDIDKVTITEVTPADGDLVEIYRMYDGVEHLYVNNATERDALVARGWKFEGVAFYTPATSSTPVHRLYHPATGDHHYTSDPTEIGSLTSKHGWRDEGVLFYGDDAQRVQLKRLFMAGLGKGEHLHTADPTELKVLTTKHGWDLEGVSFYVAKYGG